MFATPPLANLIVIRSSDIERSASFYLEIGLLLVKHSHGKGPEHFSSENCGFTFEIYPQRSPDDTTTNVRIGFNVSDVDGLTAIVDEIGGEVVSAPHDSDWGRRSVVKDFDGHTIELVDPPSREKNILKNYQKGYGFVPKDNDQ